VVSATSITCDTPAGPAGTVNVTVTTPQGTSAANPPDDDFTYEDAPTVTGVAPDNGSTAGGTPITITGTGFIGATVADIGGSNACTTDFTVVSATSITCDTPAGPAGTVNVTVTTPQGTSAANPPDDDFTYVTPPPTRLVFTTSPTKSVAGSALATQPQVTVEDASGNPVTTNASTVTLSITPLTPTSGGPGALTGCAQSGETNGVASFTGCEIDTAGTGYELRATDGALTAADSSPFTVSAGPATPFSISAPATATAGAPFTVTVTALDADANTATGYLGTVNFTSSDVAASVPASYTFVAGDNGVHTFSSGVTLVTAGSQTITATDSVTPSTTGTSGPITVSAGPITVSAGPATHFSISAPATATAGAPFTVTVTALDADANTATGYLGTVSFTSSDVAASVPASYTFVAGDNGVHTFSSGVTLVTAGSQTITATDSVTPSTTGTSGPITVSAVPVPVPPVTVLPVPVPPVTVLPVPVPPVTVPATPPVPPVTVPATPPVTVPLSPPSLVPTDGGAAATPNGAGYWALSPGGDLSNHGNAGNFGSENAASLNAPIVAISATTTGNGYWLAGADGGVFSFGDARFFGSLGNQHLNGPIVAMSGTANNGGYLLVGADGWVFSFGDATFEGSMAGTPLNRAITSMVPAPGGKGYWLVGADGGVFSFGGARFYGSLGAIDLDRHIVGIAATPDGKGYWIVGANGAVTAFGDAKFFGSLPASSTTRIVGIVADADVGYRLITAQGNAIAFGTTHGTEDATAYGSLGELS
jgi:hypothetical protein